VAPTVLVWTGLHVKLLRWARREGVREFSRRLGVSDRNVSKWDAGGISSRPREDNQHHLDVYLARCSVEAHNRFRGFMTAMRELVDTSGAPTVGNGTRGQVFEVRIPLRCHTASQARLVAAQLIHALIDHPQTDIAEARLVAHTAIRDPEHSATPGEDPERDVRGQATST
jgi:hypothetical protein